MNKSVRSSVKNNINTQNHLQKDIECFIHKFQQHDAVIITALRDDFYKYKQPIFDNNKELYSALFALGYPITELDNSYIKDYTKLLKSNRNYFHRGSYLVVNRFDQPDFIENLMKLAQYYGQQSIFVIQSGINPKGYLLGVQSKGRLKLGQKLFYPECHDLIGNPKFFEELKDGKFYFTGEIKDSNIGNSQMVDVGFQPDNWLGRWACSSMGKRVLKKAGILHSNSHQ